MTTVADRDWFNDPALKTVLRLLNSDGGEARIAGGAVRNSLMGLPVADIDIATTLTPDVVVERAEAAGLKAVPTGIAHGTVTLVVDGKPFEVTTLRRDVATDGRRAEVAFGADWQTDAERRDLTINALYARQDGTVVDLVGGLADIESRTIRFIGDAEALGRMGALQRLLARAETWQRPVFPIAGADVLAAGATAGPAVGMLLAQLEKDWLDANFGEGRASLLARLKTLVDQQP